MDAYVVGTGQSIFVEDVFGVKEQSHVVIASSLNEVPIAIQQRRQMQKQWTSGGKL